MSRSEHAAADDEATKQTRAVRNAPGPRRPGAAQAQPAARSRGGSDARAAKGSNKRAILALVADRPGITAAEISQATGMKRTVVASTVSRLKRYGELVEHESGGVCVPSSPVAASDTASGVSEVPARTSARPRRRRLNAVQARRAA